MHVINMGITPHVMQTYYFTTWRPDLPSVSQLDSYKMALIEVSMPLITVLVEF